MIELVDRAMELDPSAPRLPMHAVKAFTLQMLQRPVEALAEWDQILELTPMTSAPISAAP